MTAWRSTGHRGDVLEELILRTNEAYKNKHIGRIDKIPTPIKVIARNDQGLITKAFFEKKSTVDFQGVIQGIHVAFDAKETTLKSLPLQNIHDHQIDFMKDISTQGGLAFIIVHFKFNDTYFLLPFEMLYSYYLSSKKGGRKSIPFKALKQKFRIQKEANGLLNYIPNLNTYYQYKKDQKLHF